METGPQARLKRDRCCDRHQPDDADEDGPADDEEPADAEGVGLKDPTEMDSYSLQNPHDDNVTYRRKNDEDHTVTR